MSVFYVSGQKRAGVFILPERIEAQDKAAACRELISRHPMKAQECEFFIVTDLREVVRPAPATILKPEDLTKEG